MEEFGDRLFSMMDRFPHNGCAFASLLQLQAWFTPAEQGRLNQLGYRIVRFRPDRIIASSEHQLVVQRAKPFAEIADHVPWPSA
jgi:hypothetical protein